MDIETLNRTLRTAVEHGDGMITLRRNQYGFDWFAGRVRLNNEAVGELVTDGWFIVTGKHALIAGYKRGDPTPRIREGKLP